MLAKYKKMSIILIIIVCIIFIQSTCVLAEECAAINIYGESMYLLHDAIIFSKNLTLCENGTIRVTFNGRHIYLMPGMPITIYTGIRCSKQRAGFLKYYRAEKYFR